MQTKIFSHIKEKTTYMHGLNKPNMPGKAAIPSTQAHHHSRHFRITIAQMEVRRLCINELLQHPRTALFWKSSETTLLAWSKIIHKLSSFSSLFAPKAAAWHSIQACIDEPINFQVGQDQGAHKLGQLYLEAIARGWKAILCLAIPVHTSPVIYDQTPQLTFIIASLGV